MGVIFLRQGRPYVLESASTVRYTPLADWTRRGEGGRYVIKRLRDGDRRLGPEEIAALTQAAKRYLKRPYDPYFEWTDDRMYCSELAWKLFKSALGAEIGVLPGTERVRPDRPDRPQEPRRAVRGQAAASQKVISPAAMFESKELVEVERR